MVDASLTESGLADRDLVEIVNEVWDAYLQQPEAQLTDHEPALDIRPITAAVSITGAWEGHVRVLVPTAAAHDITGLMLAMEPDEVTDRDVTDAMGELINVVGGNLKNRGTQPAKLGLPVVATGKMLFPSTRETLRLAVGWQDKPDQPITFSVLLVHRDRPVSSRLP